MNRNRLIHNIRVLSDRCPPLRTALDLAERGHEMTTSCEVMREHVKALRHLLGQPAAPVAEGNSQLSLHLLVIEADKLERQAEERFSAAS